MRTHGWFDYEVESPLIVSRVSNGASNLEPDSASMWFPFCEKQFIYSKREGRLSALVNSQYRQLLRMLYLKMYEKMSYNTFLFCSLLSVCSVFSLYRLQCSFSPHWTRSRYPTYNSAQCNSNKVTLYCLVYIQFYTLVRSLRISRSFFSYFFILGLVTKYKNHKKERNIIMFLYIDIYIS